MKPRISAQSVPWLSAIDDHVRRCDIRGPIDRFRDIASDVFDSWAFRKNLSDLIRRRLLVVVDQGFDDSRGRDPLRSLDPKMCGAGWSVNPSERLIRALWPDRIIAPSNVKRGRSRGAQTLSRDNLTTKGEG